jgi:hypothetical protein
MEHSDAAPIQAGHRCKLVEKLHLGGGAGKYDGSLATIGKCRFKANEGRVRSRFCHRLLRRMDIDP